MKKIVYLIIIVCLLLSLGACLWWMKTKPQDNPDSTGSSTATQETTNTNQIAEDKTMVAVSVPAITEDTTDDNGTILFQYTYQHMSLVHNKPDIADKIILDFLNRVDATKTTAQSTADLAKANYNGSQNWTPYVYHITYSPTRIDHKVLSLFGNNVVFSGANHPERTCVSASYDMLTGDVLTLASIMHKDASVNDICKLVLERLGELAEGDYLYENYKSTVNHRFEGDASTDEAWYFTQTGLCFYFAPYEIAPYASGVITVEIPYEKLKNILHEAYLPESRNTPSGTVTVTPFQADKQDQFSHIAEVVISTGGNMYTAQTSGYVQDIRVILNDRTSNYTVFAANVLSAGDAVVIQTNDAMRQQMKLSYKTGNQTVTTPIG